MAHILVVDDDPAMVQFLSKALNNAGHDCVTANDGLRAFDIFKAGTFDLLLTDIVMPGMDGIALAKKAKKIAPTLKILFITGFSAMAMEEIEQFKEGEEGEKPTQVQKQVMSKPFHLNDLIQRVEDILS